MMDSQPQSDEVNRLFTGFLMLMWDNHISRLMNIHLTQQWVNFTLVLRSVKTVFTLCSLVLNSIHPDTYVLILTLIVFIRWFCCVIFCVHSCSTENCVNMMKVMNELSMTVRRSSTMRVLCCSGDYPHGLV